MRPPSPGLNATPGFQSKLSRPSGDGKRLFPNAKIPHNAMSVLATQAFLGPQAGVFPPGTPGHHGDCRSVAVVPMSQLKSSWAGAMGHTQMLPGLYLKYASDGDGDGKSDIWNSVPDALATTAKFLKASGWKPGLSWGYEVEQSTKLDCTLEGPDEGRPAGRNGLQQARSGWRAEKMARAAWNNGSELPHHACRPVRPGLHCDRQLLCHQELQ